MAGLERQSARARRKGVAPFTRRLVVMVKEPRPGRVKTRLAREIGSVRATWFYRHACSAVLGRLAASTRWQTWLSVAPDPARASRVWPHRLGRRPQGGGDLGERLQRVMDWPGRGPIVIIGTDIPAIRARDIAAAFRALGGSDAVFGPAPDGGYWLVGLRRTPRTLAIFSGVRWSSEHALADTAANLAGRGIARIAALSDVDTVEEFVPVAGWAGRRVLPSDTAPAHPLRSNTS